MNRFDTILVDPKSQGLTDNTSHPISYCRIRTQILQNISQKINVSSRVGDVDIQRNVHVDYLTRAYQRKKKQLDQLQNERHRYLNPDKFNTILGDFGVSKEEIQQRENRIKSHQRQQLYQDYVINCEFHVPKEPEKPEIEIIYGRPTAHLSHEDARIVHRKQEDLKLINRQIGRVKMQMEMDKKKLFNTGECNNVSFLQKMSNSIISSYMLHFDQIFNLLIDDILEQQVEYLNRFQEVGSEMPPEPTKTTGQKKLLSLLRQLDELCYDQPIN